MGMSGKTYSYKTYRRTAGGAFGPADIVEARLVLVLGHDNDYAVYVALDESMPPQVIAAQGDKVAGDQGRAVAEALWRVATAGRHHRG